MARSPPVTASPGSKLPASTPPSLKIRSTNPLPTFHLQYLYISDSRSTAPGFTIDLHYPGPTHTTVHKRATHLESVHLYAAIPRSTRTKPTVRLQNPRPKNATHLPTAPFLLAHLHAAMHEHFAAGPAATPRGANHRNSASARTHLPLPMLENHPQHDPRLSGGGWPHHHAPRCQDECSLPRSHGA